MGPISSEPRTPSTPTDDPSCDDRTLVCGGKPPPAPPPPPAPTCEKDDGWHTPMLLPDQDYTCLAKNMASKKAPAPAKPPPAKPADTRLIDPEPVARTDARADAGVGTAPVSTAGDAKPAVTTQPDWNEGLKPTGSVTVNAVGEIHADGTLLQAPDGHGKMLTGSVDSQMFGGAAHMELGELHIPLAGDHMDVDTKTAQVTVMAGIVHDPKGNVTMGYSAGASVVAVGADAKSHYGSAGIDLDAGASVVRTGSIEKHGDHVEMCGRVSQEVGPGVGITIHACIPDVPATILDHLIHHKG